ncbi:MAG: hypothetical protein JW932_09625 [Deltaproteobacteria bacterium]|nr:hypothetical protein [Deltaproteobacteria bacterium]
MCFDRSKLGIRSLKERIHDLGLSNILPLQNSTNIHPVFHTIGARAAYSRLQNNAVILMMGAHVIRSGVQRFIIDLMEKGYISCIAMNGAGVIHDFEFSFVGATTENVRHYIQKGQFGLWHETGKINDIVSDAAKRNLGLGEAVGMAIEEGDFPNKDISILAAGYRLGIPVTVHVGIGYDIVFELPNCDGSAYGSTSYRDFLIYTKVLESLEGGVLMNFGSAVMAPEIFLKALSMVRNTAKQEGRQIAKFTTLVCDLISLPGDFHREPEKNTPAYYFRPWKTILVRTVLDGGESFYFQGKHAETIPQLWSAISSL